MGNEFNINDFDYQKHFEEMKKQVKKPNIMICGATGAGKSSLTNDIFGEIVTNVGSGRPETRGVKLYTSEASTVNLFDTEGYEVGQDRWDYYKENIIGYINYRKNEYPQNMEEQIHEVWYCVNAANNRLLDADISTIQQILDMNIPIAIIITQIDTVAEDELEAIIDSIKTAFPTISYFTYCVTNDMDVMEAVQGYIQKNELLKWAEDHLEDGLKEGFVCAVQGSIENKRALVKKKIIPQYAALSVAAVAVPIKCADSALLMPIQVKMTMRIMSLYGIDKISGAVSSVVSSTIISTLGKSLAGSIIEIIPAVGTVFGKIINATVATSITSVLGLAISELSYRYIKAKLEGKDVLLEEYFNSEMLGQMINMFSKTFDSKDE